MPFELMEFLVRAGATALVVIGVTVIVPRLGARMGGIVVGLPIVLGPGMFFLLAEEGAGFVSDAVMLALFGIASSVLLAWSFARLAVRHGPWTSVVVASLVWAISLNLLQLLPHTLGFGVAAIAAMMIATHLLGHDPAAERAMPVAARRPIDLVVRGTAAGLLVGVVALVAPHAGPRLSGMLVAFPIALCVVGVTIHQRYGGAACARTLATAQIGMTSLATFGATLALLIGRLPDQAAFWLAVGASLLPTSLLTALRYLREAPGEQPATDGR